VAPRCGARTRARGGSHDAIIEGAKQATEVLFREVGQRVLKDGTRQALARGAVAVADVTTRVAPELARAATEGAKGAARPLAGEAAKALGKAAAGETAKAAGKSAVAEGAKVAGMTVGKAALQVAGGVATGGLVGAAIEVAFAVPDTVRRLDRGEINRVDAGIHLGAKGAIGGVAGLAGAAAGLGVGVLCGPAGFFVGPLVGAGVSFAVGAALRQVPVEETMREIAGRDPETTGGPGRVAKSEGQRA
jgi:hypothetical protein